MSEPRFCYRHPTRIAKRKCFQCARPLCPDCQKKIDHHLFCSDLCHKDHLKVLEVPLSRPPYLRYAAYVTIFLLFSGLVYFGLLADAFYSGGDKNTGTQLEHITPSLPVKVAQEAAVAESVT